MKPVQTVSVVGDRYRILLTGEDTGGAYAMFDFYVPDGHGPPMHVHTREDEAFYILEGEFEFALGDEVKRFGPGETIFGPRGVPHRFQNVCGCNGRMICVVTPAGLEKFFEEVGTPMEDATSDPVEPTEDDIRKLVEAAPRYGMQIYKAIP